MVGRLHHLAARPHRRHRLAHARQHLRNPLHDADRNRLCHPARRTARRHPLRHPPRPLPRQPAGVLPARHRGEHRPLHPLPHPRAVDHPLHPRHRRRLHRQHRRHRAADPLRRALYRAHGGKHAERSPRRTRRSGAGDGRLARTNRAQSALARSAAGAHQRAHHHPDCAYRLLGDCRLARRGRPR